jgi:UDP-N-acetylglucosamine--N-acetylmuramyl-(pentapeptide) pyrophosphoryl-undecaprenol N-acetylglucosamine transferase
MFIARIIVKRFRPDAVVGVGGYASGPVLRAASRKGIPAVIHEMNSYAGVANKLLARRADRICVAYDGMERFFPKEKIVFTGNPVRQELNDCHLQHEQSLVFFDLDAAKQTILVLGGSLGARTINQSVAAYLDRFPENLQLIWQTGKNFYETAKEQVQCRKMTHVKVFAFIQRMDLAYAAADLAVSRAGAGTVSELGITGKPCILVPSPNVAEDHQTKNALALALKNAAIMIEDSEAVEKLMPEAIATVQNHEALEPLSDNIKMMAKFHAAEAIAEEVLNLIKR